MEISEIYDEEMGEVSLRTFERYYKDTLSSDPNERAKANEWIHRLYVSPYGK